MSKGIRLYGPNGESIEDNQIIVVFDRLANCYRFVANDGTAFLVDPDTYPDLRLHDIITVDRESLTLFTGE